jgi:hypothetical protein
MAMTTTEKTMTIGTRIYNHGDIENDSHFGTLTNAKTDRWGTQYQITPDGGRPYWIPSVAISPVFQGHSGTRIVTEAAYLLFRAERMAQFALQSMRS